MIRNGKMITGLLAAVALYLAAALPAAAMGEEAIINGLSARYQNVNSITASYSRVAATPKTDQIFKGGSSQVATGLLTWVRPDKLHLDQKSPQPEAMLTDGRTVWWHIPAESIAYRYRNIDVAGQMSPLLKFLGGLDSLRRDFNISPAPAESGRPGQHGLALKPKTRDGGVSGITVWCDNNFNLTGFRLNSVTGETTDFYLTGFVENPKVNNAIFKFKAPRGTEVIDED